MDFARLQIVIHESNNNERRAVPIASPLLELLRQRSNVRRLGDNRAFPSDKPERPLDIEKAWRAALTDAKVNSRFHDLRHSAASCLAMTGATPGEIAAVLGHKTLQMVKRYAHLSGAAYRWRRAEDDRADFQGVTTGPAVILRIVGRTGKAGHPPF